MATVSFNNIGKVFDGNRAISDFNLVIADGELVVLVGPSGCGKSTLLRMLAGLESVSEGELKIDDRVANALTPQQRNIAMVFQNYALYPHMSVRRNLEFPLKMMKLDKRQMQARVNDVAALLGLTSLLDRKPKQLSGGQRQRVAMGRALVREPQVFLMDEPLSNLDAKLRLQIRAEIGALQRRMNITTLYVTHDQVEAMTLGDRVAVINQGRLQQVAEPQMLYANPANIFVAGFIGNPGMNVFKTSLLEMENERLAMQWGRRKIPLALTAHHVAALRPYLGKPLFAGLRPEAFCYAGADDAEIHISVEIASIEALGHEHLIYFRADVMAVDTDRYIAAGEEATGPLMVARLPGQAGAQVNGMIELGVALKALYFFDINGDAVSS